MARHENGMVCVNPPLIVWDKSQEVMLFVKHCDCLLKVRIGNETAGAVPTRDGAFKHIRERCHGDCVNPLIWFLPNYTPLLQLILTNFYKRAGIKMLM
jgi:hypothetical protein